jgi:hypothetical protein
MCNLTHKKRCLINQNLTFIELNYQSPFQYFDEYGDDLCVAF